MDARVFIENISGSTNIIQHISSEYAFGKLAAINSNELDLLVEDKTAFSLINSVLPNEYRSRVNIEIIGSASALARQMASIRLRKNAKRFIVVFDGDQAKNQKALKQSYLNALEKFEDKSKEEEWFESKITFLPGKEWPERWMLTEALKHNNILASVINCHPDELAYTIQTALQSEKHSEFYTLSNQLNIPPEILLDRFSVVLAQNSMLEFTDIIVKVDHNLT